MTQFSTLKKPDKARVTLADDSIILISTDLISEVSQGIGDVANVHNICGVHPLFGVSYCSECTAKGNLDGCGKWFVVFSRRGDSGPVTIHLKDGGVLYPKAFELIEDDTKSFIQPDGPRGEMEYLP